LKFFKAELAADADVIDPDELLNVVDVTSDVEGGLRPSIFPSVTIASPHGMVFS
jgi:hypothetical protein